MRKIIIMFAVGLLMPQFSRAQGTVYLSNLEQTATSSSPVGSDSWWAASFLTGTNAAGYLLDSIQLGMTNATGSPSGFTVALYSAVGRADVTPGINLAMLDGSSNPSTTSIYTYTPDLSLILPPATPYFIVLTAGTTIANGAYEWNNTGPSTYNRSDHWLAPFVVIHDDNYQSSNGSTWIVSGLFPQFAITAEAVPEPSPSLLLLLGSGILFYVHKRRSS